MSCSKATLKCYLKYWPVPFSLISHIQINRRSNNSSMEDINWNRYQLRVTLKQFELKLSKFSGFSPISFTKNPPNDVHLNFKRKSNEIYCLIIVKIEYVNKTVKFFPNKISWIMRNVRAKSSVRFMCKTNDFFRF